MTENALPPLPGDRKHAAAYFADMAGSLAKMARGHGYNTLGYLFDMAKLEAESVNRANGSAP